MKKVIYATGVVAAVFIGCGQAPDSGSAGDSFDNSSDALGTVQGCIAQANDCARNAKSAADGLVCKQSLSACLAPLLPRPGQPPVVVSDAGNPRAAIRACVATLRACLSSSTDPMVCAEQVRTCIQQAITPVTVPPVVPDAGIVVPDAGIVVPDTGTTPPGTGPTCTVRFSNGTDDFAADCVNGTCSCTKNGGAPTTCTMTSSDVCGSIAAGGSVKIACCPF